MACVDPALRPKHSAKARSPHFLGLDLGLAGDGTAVAIGHLEEHKERGAVVVLDYIGSIKAGEGEYQDQERLEFDDVADWIAGLAKRFFITEGLFDQWAGIPLEPVSYTHLTLPTNREV